MVWYVIQEAREPNKQRQCLLWVRSVGGRMYYACFGSRLSYVQTMCKNIYVTMVEYICIQIWALSIIFPLTHKHKRQAHTTESTVRNRFRPSFEHLSCCPSEQMAADWLRNHTIQPHDACSGSKKEMLTNKRIMFGFENRASEKKAFCWNVQPHHDDSLGETHTTLHSS